MKGLIKKSWFQITIAGVLLGTALILLDNRFDWTGSKKKTKEMYEGPVTIEKDKAYVTTASLDLTEFDFGKVKEGDTLSHVFKLKNTGDEPLFVYKSDGACDCVAAIVTKEMIPPGATTDVTTYFNTKGRKGVQRRTINLTCNTDPAVISFQIKAEVQ